MTRQDLNKILTTVDEDARVIAKAIIGEILFQQGVLRKLKRAIKEQGVVATYSNGAPRESPALKSYNVTIQRYSNLCKQLELMIRKDTKIDTGEDALKSWLQATK